MRGSRLSPNLGVSNRHALAILQRFFMVISLFMHYPSRNFAPVAGAFLLFIELLSVVLKVYGERTRWR